MSDGDVTQQISYDSHPEYAIAALLQMLVRFPLVDRHAMAGSIAAHLQYIFSDPRYPEPVRQAAYQGWTEWTAMIEMRFALERQKPLLN